MTHGAAANVRFRDLFDFDGRHHARGHAAAFECILQSQRVDDGGQHSHVVALSAVHAFAGSAQATEDVTAADHDADLHAGGVNFGELGRRGLERGGVDAGAPFFTAQHLSAQLDDYTSEFQLWIRFHDRSS